MEGNSVYKDSYDELKRIKKQLGSSKITINLEKLDENSKRAIITSLSCAIAQREATVNATISGSINSLNNYLGG